MILYRNILGLRSADFDIEKKEDGITFTTRGYGHGVGMSQYGANGYAKNGYNYKFTLTDDRGNGLANENVVITFNGKTETVSTDSLGVVNYKLVATKAGTQKLTIKFDSDKNYVSSTLTATVKISKEATKLTAKKKTFKAKVKTKKYAVTLKDSKGKAIKKVKVTLKVKGKTYKATTNAKGKATFKIKN